MIRHAVAGPVSGRHYGCIARLRLEYAARSSPRSAGVPQVIKPRTPPGIMELLPREQIAFQRMLDVIRRNYERFGFLPVETPVFELSDVLLTKSGGET
ncbi:MAG: hypothetical protein ACREPC_08910, partial [Stenotrophomonas sp.]